MCFGISTNSIMAEGLPAGPFPANDMVMQCDCCFERMKCRDVSIYGHCNNHPLLHMSMFRFQYFCFWQTCECFSVQVKFMDTMVVKLFDYIRPHLKYVTKFLILNTCW